MATVRGTGNSASLVAIRNPAVPSDSGEEKGLLAFGNAGTIVIAESSPIDEQAQQSTGTTPSSIENIPVTCTVSMP